MKDERVRFLIAGTANTLLTLFVYQALLLWFEDLLSFSISFWVGIFITSYLYPTFVFKVKANVGNGVLNGIWYFTSYCIGLLLMHIAVETIHINERLAIFFVIFIMVPMNFLMTRIIFRRGGI